MDVPSLPGCFSQGETIDEAMNNVREAIELHIQGLKDEGQEIPKKKISDWPSRRSSSLSMDLWCNVGTREKKFAKEGRSTLTSSPSVWNRSLF